MECAGVFCAAGAAAGPSEEDTDPNTTCPGGLKKALETDLRWCHFLIVELRHTVSLHTVLLHCAELRAEDVLPPGPCLGCGLALAHTAQSPGACRFSVPTHTPPR